MILAISKRLTKAGKLGLSARNMTVPPAGGCSISMVTMARIAAPTAKLITSVGGIIPFIVENDNPIRPQTR